MGGNYYALNPNSEACGKNQEQVANYDQSKGSSNQEGTISKAFERNPECQVPPSSALEGCQQVTNGTPPSASRKEGNSQGGLDNHRVAPRGASVQPVQPPVGHGQGPGPKALGADGECHACGKRELIWGGLLHVTCSDYFLLPPYCLHQVHKCGNHAPCWRGGG